MEQEDSSWLPDNTMEVPNQPSMAGYIRETNVYLVQAKPNPLCTAIQNKACLSPTLGDGVALLQFM